MQTRDVLPTVVLGCAKGDRLLLPPMLEGLIAAGFEVEVASGLETRGDPLVAAGDPLLAAAARLREAAYVLLASQQLPALMTEQLRMRLLAASVPARRIVTIQIDDDSTGAIDVAQRLAALGIVASHVRRPTSVRLGAAKSASESSGTRPTTIVGVVPQLPPPQVAPPPPPVGARPQVQLPVSGSVPVLDVDIEDDAPPTRKRAFVIGGVAAGLVALVAIIAASGSDPEPTAAETAAVKAQWTALYERATESITPAPTVVPAAQPTALASPVIVPVPVPAEIVVAAATPDVSPKPELAPPPVLPPPPATPEAVEIVAEEDGAPHVDEIEIQSIYAGLVSQKFRALDIVLVSPEPRKKKGKRVYKTPAKLTWSAAKTYCEKLEIDGVAGWRLPRVGELGSLSTGELLPDGKFWSQTEGDTFGRSRVVWNTKTEKMGLAPVKWKGGRVVCVRTLAKAPVLPAAK